MFMCRICDLNIAVENIHPAIPSRFTDYMIDACSPDITVSFTEAEVADELAKCPANGIEYSEFMLIFRKLTLAALEFNTFFFHSSVVKHEDEAYIFTGKSGAGKSTHSLLWVEHFGAEIINGDKPLFRLINGEFYAYGSPWAGKENFHKNDKAKIKAVAFIEQSTELSVSRMSVAEVLGELFNQTVYMNEPHQNAVLLRLIDKFLSDIPFYRLRCDISKKAAELSKKAMKGGC